MTSHNNNIPKAYLVGASFFGVHKSNPFVSSLMFVYEIRFYVDISSIAYHFSTIKQIGDKYFSKNNHKGYKIQRKNEYKSR